MFPFHRTRISTLSITCFYITEYVFLHHQIHISISPNTHFRSPFVGTFIYAGTINRPLRLRTVCECVANILQTPTLTYEMGCKHSARRRGRFIAPVSWHYQIHIFTSSNTCFRFTAHAYPHYQLRVFTLLNTYIHFTEYVHLHYRTRISTLPNTCICIIKYTFPHTAHAFPPPFLWVNTDMRAR